MTANISNQVPFLRVSRLFPADLQQLTIEVNKAYLDIATAVNNRTIGVYATNFPSVTGDSWFITPQKQQTLRQIYSFSASGNIPHGLNLANISQISPNCYGSFTDGTNYYGAIYASNVAIAGQVSFFINPTNIVILAGAGSPTIQKGIIVLEWISNV